MMAVPELDADVVRLVPGKVILESSRELTQHFITDYPVSPTLVGGYKDLVTFNGFHTVWYL